MTVKDVIIEPVLWTYAPLKNGDLSIYLRLTYYKDVKYLGTGLSSSTVHWDSENFCPYPSHPCFRDILRKIDKLTEEVKFEIELAEKEERQDLTLAEIKRNIRNKCKPKQDAPKAKMTLFELYNYLIDDYEERGNTGYSDVFKSSRNSVQKIIKQDKPFDLIPEEDFYKYERYLATKNTESTKSLYLRTFYRVWNIAIKKGYCRKGYHPKEVIEMKKRKVIKLYVDEESHLTKALISLLFRFCSDRIWSYIIELPSIFWQ